MKVEKFKKVFQRILLLSIYVFPLFVSGQENPWQQMKSLDISARRFVATSFSIGSKGYVGTGLIGDSLRKDFWEYDAVSDTWSQKADFAGGKRTAAVGFSVGSKGYVGTGLSGDGEQKDFWEYDPNQNTWTKKRDFEGAPRVVATGFAIGNKGYIGNGRTDNFLVYFNDFWEYDPANDAWTQKSDFPGGERYATTAFTIGNTAYVGLGTERRVSEFYFKKDFWAYDPQTNAWTRKADFGGTSRELASAFVLGEQAYVLAGYNGNDLKDFWQYNPKSDTWTRLSDFPGGTRYAAVAFTINNMGYVGMGMSTVRERNDLWRYSSPGSINKSDTSTVPESRSKKVNIKY